MKKDNFYLCLNVLNILLCLSTYLTLLIFFIIFSIAENSFIPICLIFLSILVKIILLYVLFNTFEKFFPNFTLSKVAIELKTNINSRKSTLLLAFTYDVVIMLYCILFFSIKEYCKRTHGLISCYRWFDYFRTLCVWGKSKLQT